MMECQGIYRSFGAHEVLRGVSVRIPEGKRVGLIGPSGAGKSVLLKILGGVQKPDSGRVLYDAKGCRELSLMFQEGALFDSLSVLDNVAFPLVGGRVPITLLPLAEREHVFEEVRKVLSRVGLVRAMHKMPGQLSGGMRRRVSLARALVAKPEVVFLDDPTAGLDPVASSAIMTLIRELHSEYRPSIVVASHDLRRLLPMVDIIWGLFDGQMVFNGTLAELAASGNHELTRFVSCRYDLPMAA